MQAVFSADGRYRHALIEPGRYQCGWCMLNPSVAGGVVGAETISDRTNDRVRNFSRSWGYDGYVICNVYDLVSTDPDGLWSDPAPVSPANDSYLQGLATLPLVVVGWGKNATRERALHVERVLRAGGAELWCLGVNGDGSPKHPLYLAHTTPLQRWPGL
jgi:hypothetical protein